MTMRKLVEYGPAWHCLLGAAAGNGPGPDRPCHLADYSGPTSDVGTAVRSGCRGTPMPWINKNGGINGAKVNVDTVDYGYQVPRAIAQLQENGRAPTRLAAILGWGTADTEALTGFLAEDKIPDISASYAAALFRSYRRRRQGQAGAPTTSSTAEAIRTRCAAC